MPPSYLPGRGGRKSGRLVLAFFLLAALPAAGQETEREEEKQDETPVLAPFPERERNFGAALGEVMAFNVLPNLWNRLVLHKPMGQITLNTWSENLSRGFAYDPDKFVTNGLSHPQHGGLYYGAARANGYGFWESGLFTAFGSLTWEYFGEATRPSTNDLINTTFAGINAGETSYRLSDLVLDNTATGASRVLHEIAGLATSPGRSFQRLFSGDAWRVSENPPGVRPGWLEADLRGGILTTSSNRPPGPAPPDGASTKPWRGTVAWDVRYGDPFEKDLGKPFSTFRLEAEATTSKNFVSRVDSEGTLAGWRLDGTGPERTVVAATLGFVYDNVDLSYGGETLGLEIQSRIPLGKGYDLTPRAQLLGAFSGIQTSEDSVTETYRNYDWGLGGGLSAGVRIRKQGRDVVRLDAADLLFGTVNGPTVRNEVRMIRAGAFYPVTPTLSIGGEYTYHRHRNIFPTTEELRTSRQVRALLSWTVFAGKP